jgi:hypothetical protein
MQTMCPVPGSPFMGGDTEQRLVDAMVQDNEKIKEVPLSVIIKWDRTPQIRIIDPGYPYPDLGKRWFVYDSHFRHWFDRDDFDRKACHALPVFLYCAQAHVRFAHASYSALRRRCWLAVEI